jgi:DNA-binding NarL/FixJ family response regulator
VHDEGAVGTTVTILEQAEVYRRGLTAVLEEAGHRVAASLGAALDPAVCAVVISIREPSDWDDLAALVASPVPVVALVEDGDAAAPIRALRAGAAGAVGRAAPADEILATLDAAVQGHLRLPLGLARQLMVAPNDAPLAVLTDEEVAWLRSLAMGVRIADLAHISGHSERAMYRLLRRLYQRMGVADRTGALLTATRWGLLADREVAADAGQGVGEAAVEPRRTTEARATGPDAGATPAEPGAPDTWPGGDVRPRV